MRCVGGNGREQTGKNRAFTVAYRRRRADLSRGGGQEDPEASAVEEPADWRRAFRFFSCVKKQRLEEGRVRRWGGRESTRAAWSA
jgi:hypothetical protein